MDRDEFIVFPTELGWIAACWSDRGLFGVTFGDPSAQQAVRRLTRPEPASVEVPRKGAAEEFERRCRAYATGQVVSFHDLTLDPRGMTDFQRRVLEACRRIEYGDTASYRELAARAGSPRAARAVGNVMARNRLPLIVPCHRVVASGGRLGGFSSPDGLDMKRRLLALEQVGRRASTGRHREPATPPRVSRRTTPARASTC